MKATRVESLVFEGVDGFLPFGDLKVNRKNTHVFSNVEDRTKFGHIYKNKNHCVIKREDDKDSTVAHTLLAAKSNYAAGMILLDMIAEQKEGKKSKKGFGLVPKLGKGDPNFYEKTASKLDTLMKDCHRTGYQLKDHVKPFTKAVLNNNKELPEVKKMMEG